MTKVVFRGFRVMPAACLVMVLAAGPAFAQLSGNKDEVEGMTRDGSQTQAQIDQLDDRRDELEAQYRTTLSQLEALQIYNEQQRRLIAKQEEDLATVQSQIEGVTALTRDLTPLMVRMVDSIEQFVELDLPFLQEQRRNRVMRLRELLDSPEASPADRYRAILQAYQAENEYGRTIQTYSAKLTLDGVERDVEFLRIGRVVLYYQTPDQQETGIFNPDTREWEVLGNNYNVPVRTGIKMAAEIVPPDVMVLPVPVSAN